MVMTSIFNDEIDEDCLREKYKADPLFRTLADFLASQATDESYLSVPQLCERMAQAGVAVRRTDIIRALQSLSGECGRFIVGRKGYDSRFDFHAPSTMIGKIASGQESKRAMVEPPRMLAHKFRLRADLEISFELPADLSKREVARISEFLKTLPFDEVGLHDAA